MTVHFPGVFEWLAGTLPLCGIALSWWSFRFAEEGATPDAPMEYGRYIDIVEQDLKRGMRDRARRCARMLFGAGALLLAAAVPMGAASAPLQGDVNLPAIGGFTIIACAAIYIVFEVLNLWKSRRDDAFNLYYSKDMFYLYDRNKTAQVYFDLNPMPVWSLLDRNWFLSRKLPDIDEIAARATKTATAQPRHSETEDDPLNSASDVRPDRS
jgi:hypothetical protein